MPTLADQIAPQPKKPEGLGGWLSSIADEAMGAFERYGRRSGAQRDASLALLNQASAPGTDPIMGAGQKLLGLAGLITHPLAFFPTGDEWRERLRNSGNDGQLGQAIGGMLGDLPSIVDPHLLAGGGALAAAPIVGKLGRGISDLAGDATDAELAALRSRLQAEAGQVGGVANPTTRDEALLGLVGGTAQDTPLASKIMNKADDVAGILPKDIRSPKFSEIQNAGSGTYSGKWTTSEDILPISSISGGTYGEVNDDQRVRDLASAISSPSGYFERIIVDDGGNVIEGAHRIDALRSLGVTDIPVIRISPVDNSVPSAKMIDAIKAAAPTRDEHAQQLVDHIAEIIASGDNVADYAAPSGFERQWAAAIKVAQKDKGKMSGSTKQGSGPRAGYVGEGMYEYDMGDGYMATRMGNNIWNVFKDGMDVGEDFKTLAAARKWHKANKSK